MHVNTAVESEGINYHAERLRAYVRAMREALRLGCPRVVLYQAGAGGLGLWYQVGLVILARILRYPQVFHHHSYSYLNRRSLAMRVLTSVGGVQLKHVVLSQNMQRDLKAMYHCENVVVISNAVALGQGGSVEADSPGMRTRGDFVIGHLSNLTRAKGVCDVMEAGVLLRESGFPVAVRLAGPVANHELQKQIESHLDAQPSDEWVGALDPRDVADFMRGLDCFVFPSRYINEALPLVVLEALREGVPVVGTSVGCLPEVLGSAGWLTRPGAVNVAQAISRVIGDTGAQGRALSIYRDLLSAGSLDDLVREVIPSA